MAKLEELKNLRIGIFGYGTEGKSLFNYLISKGCGKIIVFDEKIESADLEAGSELVNGKFEDQDYSELDIVFRSPGIQVLRLKKILPEALKISSPTNLFFENCRAKTIGITGTKGKSTTALLVAKTLKNNSKKVFVVGNIGDPMLDVLDEADENSYCVIELSSFQLQDLEYKPDAAIILPILIDHLDYHGDEQEYFIAKRNIISEGNQEVICDYETAQKLNLDIEKIVTYSIESSPVNCSVTNEGFTCKNYDSKNVLKGALEFSENKKVPLVDLLAAYSFSVVQKMNFDLKDFENFEKLPFRVQLVAKINQTNFYNDSASTNPISTMKAMEMMTGPYDLIIGGSAKGVSFKDLAVNINNDSNLKKVYVFGATADQLSELIRSHGDKQYEAVDKLEDVFKNLRNEISHINSVLFSPACASFDQYDNYKERGEDFNKLVQTING